MARKPIKRHSGRCRGSVALATDNIAALAGDDASAWMAR
jgi:hypothetical protein